MRTGGTWAETIARLDHGQQGRDGSEEDDVISLWTG